MPLRLVPPRRLNRNGIPILDPEGVNHLPKNCQHEWVTVSERFVDRDWMAEQILCEREVRCRLCGNHDVQKRWEDC